MDERYLSKVLQEVPTLRQVELEDVFRQPIHTYNIPTNITHLLNLYNNNVQDLPNSITHITFGEFFDSTLELPPSITHLSFDGLNKSVDGVLPPGILHLAQKPLFKGPLHLKHSVPSLATSSLLPTGLCGLQNISSWTLNIIHN